MGNLQVSLELDIVCVSFKCDSQTAILLVNFFFYTESLFKSLTTLGLFI